MARDGLLAFLDEVGVPHHSVKYISTFTCTCKHEVKAGPSCTSLEDRVFTFVKYLSSQRNPTATGLFAKGQNLVFKGPVGNLCSRQTDSNLVKQKRGCFMWK